MNGSGRGPAAPRPPGAGPDTPRGDPCAPSGCPGLPGWRAASREQAAGSRMDRGATAAARLDARACRATPGALPAR